MARISRTLVVLCIFAVAFLLVEGEASRVRPRAMRPFHSKFHSLSQACRGVLEDECPHGGEDRADCILENFDKFAVHECKLWVSWRTTCLSYATIHLVPEGKCGFTPEESTSQRLRECVRTADMSLAPATCTMSPYFKSLMKSAPRVMDSDDEADL